MLDEAVLKQLASQALGDPPFPDPRFPPSPYYRFLKLLARNLQPKLSVELGVCGGGGSLHLAVGCLSGIVVGVDIARDHPENTDFILELCPNFRFWLGDSVASAAAIHQKYGEVGILFIDSVHTFEQSRAEFEAYRPYLSNQAVVCFDDLFRSEMAGFWEWLPGPKLRLDQLHDGAECGGGFGVVWTLKENG